MKKNLKYLFFLIVLGSCSKRVAINSSLNNSGVNPTLVDKKTNTIISATNDQTGVLINIKIPNTYDQYKVLKYGGYLSITLPKELKKSFVIA